MLKYYIATNKSNDVIAYGDGEGDVGMEGFTVDYFIEFEPYQAKLAEHGFIVSLPIPLEPISDLENHKLI